MTETIQLGFEVGTGTPVEIPIRHMVVAGQTQEAGKTTTMEALISRGKLPAIAFVTKRGEQSFSKSRKVAPYFRERADWQFVASVLEATMRERFKFERSWIISASKGAKTLADVQKNVRTLMKISSGLSESVYLTLDAYLDIVVPKLAKVEFAKRLDISRGINTLDLSHRDNFPPELQSLVMRSCLEWVYERCEGTIAIIPEAWEFIPQSRGSPVKLAAVELLRKGAGLRNYVWLDSQDIGGIDKEVLRQCAVWLLGVQRETNEIKRTLANIPAGISRPSTSDIAHLDKGQFFACWGKHVIKTYVWPDWMEEWQAKAIAKGELSPAQLVHLRDFKGARSKLTPPPKGTVVQTEPGFVLVTEKGVKTLPKESEETVTHDEAEQLISENQKLRQRIEELELKLVKPEPAPARSSKAPVEEGLIADYETFYQVALERILREPAIIELQTTKPELRVSETRETVQLDGKTLRGRVVRLLADGYFDEPNTASAAWTELKRIGFSTAKPNVYKECDLLAEMGFLTKESSGYQAVGNMKKNIVRA